MLIVETKDKKELNNWELPGGSCALKNIHSGVSKNNELQRDCNLNNEQEM